jgi:SUKH superfamily protein
MWKELIDSLTKEAELFLPAQEQRLHELGVALGVDLPEDLMSFLRESDGATGPYGVGLVWTSNRIETDNLAFRRNPEFRELYMPFDHLLFFADAGNGDQFAFAIAGGIVRMPDVYVWNHENDSRVWVAPSLEKYLDWWLSGKLKV